MNPVRKADGVDYARGRKIAETGCREQFTLLFISVPVNDECSITDKLTYG